MKAIKVAVSAAAGLSAIVAVVAGVQVQMVSVAADPSPRDLIQDARLHKLNACSSARLAIQNKYRMRYGFAGSPQRTKQHPWPLSNFVRVGSRAVEIRPGRAYMKWDRSTPSSGLAPGGLGEWRSVPGPDLSIPSIHVD